MIVEVIYADVKNLNDRIYSKNTLLKVINMFNPKKDNFGYFSSFNNNKEISHKTNSLFFKNNILYADITLLDTKYGNIIKNDILHYSFTLKTIANVDDDGYVSVSDFLSIDAIFLKNDSYPQKIRKNKLKKLNENRSKSNIY